MRNPRFRTLALLASLLVLFPGFGRSPALAQGPGRPATAPTLLVSEVTLIDGTGSAAQTNVSILVRGGRVEDILPASAASPAADIIVNGHGLFAIPGLIDAHVHLSPSPMNERIEQLRQTLEGGVTTVFDLAGDCRETSDLARMEIAGEIRSPSIYYVALFSGPAFFKDPRVIGSSLGFRPGDAPWAREITPETDMVQAVAAARGTGAISLKLYAALDAGEVRNIADEARRQQMRLVAHATVFPAKPGDLVAAGVNMLAHAPYLVWEGSPAGEDFTRRARGDFEHVPVDSSVIETLLASMHDRDVALNPTLWIFAEGEASKDPVSRLRTPWMNAVTRRAAQLGVRIVAGTDDMLDAAVDRLPILHKELETLVSGAGLTPAQALVAASSNAARVMGIDRSTGTVEKGKAADLVLLEANPVENITNTRRIRYVIKDGRIVFDRRSPR
jgi:imidazolonepropionase-like amidohydrolase